MKTLVIHPQDYTTDVLSLIYKDKKNWTIINDCNISNNKLTDINPLSGLTKLKLLSLDINKLTDVEFVILSGDVTYIKHKV